MEPHDAKRIIYFLSADVVPGASPLPLSPVLRLAQPLASLMTLTPPTPPPVASPSTTAATAPETTSAAGGDERPSELSSPTQTPDLEPEAEPETENDAETEEEKARRLLYCSLCKVAVNSASQLEAHNSGKRRVLTFSAKVDITAVFVVIMTEVFEQKTKDVPACVFLVKRSGFSVIIPLQVVRVP